MPFISHAMTVRTACFLAISILASASLTGVTALAQESRAERKIAVAKLDARLKAMMNAPASSTMLAAQGDRTGMIPVFIRGDVPRAAAAVERAGGTVGTRLQGILTARIPHGEIARLALDPSIERMEASAVLQPSDDSLSRDIKADRVHSGQAPLPQGYTGKGVIIGVIDTGIDIDHLEFRNRADTSRSRIVAVWSQQDATGISPQGFDYGTEWESDVIEQEIDGIPAGPIYKLALAGGTHGTYGVHGTHVTGIAAGLQGVAPDADIIFVQPVELDGDAVFAAPLLDAANYIYAKAEQLGRPCVINLSMSDIVHPHDGSDLFSQALDQLIAARPGRAFCASAGNSGSGARHWGGFPVESDSVWTYLYPSQNWYLRVPDADLATLQFSVMVDSIFNSARGLEPTPWRTVQSVLDADGALYDTIYSDKSTGDMMGFLNISAASLGNGYTELIIGPALNDFTKARFYVRGAGTFHMWSHVFANRYEMDSPIWANNSRRRYADNLYDMGRPAIANAVIGVGSAVNRTKYVDSRGTAHDNPTALPTGSLSMFSTRGPTVDGRIKPDIVAPGEFVISARSHFLDEPQLVLGSDTTMVVLSGTSMSTPATAGAVALYLQKNPTADFNEIRNAIVTSARQDAFTASNGPIPNGHWGNGKLDIFAALAQSQSDVEFDRNGNYVSDAVSIRSNPTTGTAVLRMVLPRASTVDLALSNLAGEEALRTSLGTFGTGAYSLPLELGNLTQGVYAYRVTIGETIHSGTLQIVR